MSRDENKSTLICNRNRDGFKLGDNFDIGKINWTIIEAYEDSVLCIATDALFKSSYDYDFFMDYAHSVLHSKVTTFEDTMIDRCYAYRYMFKEIYINLFCSGEMGAYFNPHFDLLNFATYERLKSNIPTVSEDCWLSTLSPYSNDRKAMVVLSNGDVKLDDLAIKHGVRPICTLYSRVLKRYLSEQENDNIEESNKKLEVQHNPEFPTIYFAKVDEKSIIPSKTQENGGYDVYACFEEDYIDIPPHEIKMIPTGIASAFSDDYVMVLRERGSTGTKGMAIRAGVIDSGYRGEWFVPICNVTDNWMFITKISKEEIIRERGMEVGGMISVDPRESNGVFYPYSKAICQALLLPVPKVVAEEIPLDELQCMWSERGTGALGSSNK
jgi:dUTP pyrophosphatase